MKRLLWIFIITFNLNVIAQEFAPILSNFRIENSHKDRVYFDVEGDISGLTKQGFVISGKTVSGVNAAGSYFTVSQPFTFWDNNTIRLGENSDVLDVNPKLHNFTLTFIDNQINEPDASIYRYVSTSGSSNGTTEGNAASFSYMMANAKAGETWWVKAGVYAITSSNSFTKSGTLTSPIKIIGYKATIGDISVLPWNYGDGVISSDMPFITSSTASVSGFQVTESNVIVRNIGVSATGSGSVGFYLSSSDNVVIDRCVSYNTPEYGILGYNNNTNCRYKDSKVQGARFNVWQYGNYNLIDNVESHSGSRTTYLTQIEGSYNIIKNTLLSRAVDNPSHTGHGINFNIINGTETAYNLAVDCQIMNTDKGIEFRKGNSHDNVARNLHIYNNSGSGSEDTGGITFRDGSHNNIVENCLVDIGISSNSVSVRLTDSSESGTGMGSNNILRNSIIINSRVGVFLETSQGSQTAELDILNCTFDNINRMFRHLNGSSSFASSNFKNNSVTNITDFVYNGTVSGMTFDYNNFYNSPSPPSGTNNLSVNPNFEDAPNENFKLKSNSPLRDKGIILEEVKIDFEGKPRPKSKNPDIGAHQYQDNSTTSIRANAGEDQTICIGESVTLTASGGSSYSWNTGATTKSITVTPAETTTYTVTVSEGTASDNDSVTVSVNSVTAEAGDNKTITEGETITLTASGGDSYLWSTGTTTQSITVNPTSTKTYTVTVTKDGCIDTDTIQVTVNPVTGTVTANAGSDQSICQGEGATLTASGGSSYSWSTGATTESITVNPNSTTTYTVTVYDESNSDTDDVIVTVNTVTASAGPDIIINQGETAKLTSNGGDSYLWSTEETTQDITVKPNTTTTYSVTVTKNGCEDTDEVVVAVNTSIGSVTANAGLDETICLGENVTLIASGGSTYSWSTGATTKSITVNPNTTTTYTVTVSEGGSSSTDSVQVTVNNVTANAGSDKTIDQGENVKLTASGGDSYLWNNGATSKSITVNPTETAIYTVSVIKYGCEDTDNVQVTVLEINISNPPEITAFAGDDISICLGESVSLNASGGDTYTWSTGANQKSIQVNPSRTTIYTLTANNGGVTTTDSVVVSVENCNISATNKDELETEFVVFPNPTKGVININVNNANNNLNLVLISLNGSILYSEKMNLNQGSLSKQIDLSSYAKGIYFVKLFNSNLNMVKKILII